MKLSCPTTKRRGQHEHSCASYIAGVGNIFLGDDAFGVEVAQRLCQRPQPEGVRVTDFGIRGLDLAYALLETWDVAILIDACPASGHTPRPRNALPIIEPEHETSSAPPQPDELIVQTHNMDPAKVLRLVWAMGGRLERLLLPVGCEPANLGNT